MRSVKRIILYDGNGKFIKTSSANDKHYKLWNYKGSFYYILLENQVGFSQPAPHTWSEIKDGGQTMSWSYRRLLVDNTMRVTLP